MLLKQKPSNKTFVKWIARFYYFRHLYSAGSACIAHNNCMSCPSIWATHLHCSLIYFWVPFQLFLHSDQPLRGEITSFSGVCQSGGGCYPRRRRWLHVGQTAATDDDQRQHHHAEHHFQLQHQLTSVLHRVANITLTHLHVSNCRVRQLQFSGIFVALGFVGTALSA